MAVDSELGSFAVNKQYGHGNNLHDASHQLHDSQCSFDVGGRVLPRSAL